MTLSFVLKMCMNDPLSLMYYLTKGRDYLTKKRLSKITKRPLNEITEYYNELEKSKFLLDKFSNKKDLGQIRSPGWIYSLCRIMNPRIVVETGVASGLSSAYILKALEDNGTGRLISIDMPNFEQKLIQESNEYSTKSPEGNIPQGKNLGWLVPNDLRNRWTLKIGLVKNILVPILDELGKIDIFFHDSEHTYENMMYEFRNAWSHIRKGGLLLSDDVDWNNSFSDFAREVNKNFETFPYINIGLISK